MCGARSRPLTNKNYAIGMNRNGVFKIQAELGRCGIFLTVVAPGAPVLVGTKTPLDLLFRDQY